MVLTFRNLHNWVGDGDDGKDDLFKAIHKPEAGRRAGRGRPPPAGIDDAGRQGLERLCARVVCDQDGRSAGFKLAGKSEVNANPKDKADHKGACGRCRRPWPTRTRTARSTMAIGESDRMTLKFVKQ
jgi:predicted methyltransferase